MKAQIYINRHIVAQNKKYTKETGVLIDTPAISINTYKGSIYAKKVELPSNAILIQDASSARCSGATIWIEAPFENLIIDGQPADRNMFKTNKQNLKS
jgi:hypothetical protein